MVNKDVRSSPLAPLWAYAPLYLDIHEYIHYTYLLCGLISLCSCTYMNVYITHILFVGKAFCVSICTYVNAFTIHTQAHIHAHTHTHTSKKEKLNSVSLVVITKIPCGKFYAFQAFRKNFRIFCSFDDQTQSLGHAREALWGSATFQTLVCFETKFPFVAWAGSPSYSFCL